MGREDRKRGVGVRDTEEGPGDAIDERVRNKRGEHGRRDHHRVEPGKQERLEREEDACHGVGVDAGNKTAYDAASDTDDGAAADTEEHA